MNTAVSASEPQTDSEQLDPKQKQEAQSETKSWPAGKHMCVLSCQVLEDT